MARTVPYGEGRELLISSAVHVVAERGLRGLTFRAVAERAGVNSSLGVHHFGTREALLSAALEWSVERSIESTGLLTLDDEHRFADALLASITAQPELQIFQYEMILEARRNPIFRAPVARLYERYHEAVRQSLEQFGVDDDLSARARHVFAALDGLVMQHVVGVDDETLRAALHDIWASVERARRSA